MAFVCINSAHELRPQRGNIKQFYKQVYRIYYNGGEEEGRVRGVGERGEGVGGERGKVGKKRFKMSEWWTV